MLIQKLDRVVDKSYSILEVYCKDGRYVRLAFTHQLQHDYNIFTRLHAFTFPQSLLSRFPFKHNYRGALAGWSVYDLEQDMRRIGMLGEESPWVIFDNSRFDYCDSYPPYLLVPRDLSTEEVKACANFRAKSRLPALVWGRDTTLWRSSQPKTGIRT